SLYADLVGHWQKRNPRALRDLDPANFDHALIMRLVSEYGDEKARAHLDAIGALFARPLPRPAQLDDFASCGIERAEDVRALFEPNFYFGCEADDPANALAFNTRANPFGARLRAILGSDFGHW